MEIKLFRGAEVKTVTGGELSRARAEGWKIVGESTAPESVAVETPVVSAEIPATETASDAINISVDVDGDNKPDFEISVNDGEASVKATKNKKRGRPAKRGK
jgi:hypothetical protein